MATKPIVIAIQGNDENLKKALKRAGKNIDGFGKRVGKMALKAGGAFAGLAGVVGGVGVKAFQSYDTQLREVLTLLPEAGDQAFDELGAKVQKFSKEFGVLPEKAIPALYQALSAGIPKDDVFSFMETSQRAAKGGVAELEVAVDALTSVVASYASTGMTAAEASDLLFTSVRLGKLDFGSLAGEIYKTAPIASAVGIEFKNITAALAQLTAAGTPVAQASTQLKAAMAELAKEGTKADKAFREFAGQGLATFLEGGGTFEEALIGLSEQATNSGKNIMDLFGSLEAGQAILGLTADGGVKFSETLREMEKASGATESAFSVMDAGMAASMDRIKANVAVLAIKIGEKLAPVVEKATALMLKGFENLEPAIQDVRKATETAIKWVKKHQTAIMLLSGAIGGLIVGATGLKAYTAAVVVITNAKKTLIATTLMWNAALAANPIGIVVVALAALAGALVAAYFRFEQVREIIDNVARFFRDTFLPVVQVVIDMVVEAFKFLWTEIKLFVDLVVALFKEDWGDAAKIFQLIIKNAIEFVVSYFVQLPGRLLRLIGVINSALRFIAKQFVTQLTKEVKKSVDEIVSFFKGLPARLISAGVNIGQSLIRMGLQWGSNIITAILEGLRRAGGAISGYIMSLVPDVGSIVDSIVGGARSKAKSLVKSIIPGFASGGIVTRPTLALVGEAGPEAIVPLNRGGGGVGSVHITVNTGVGDPVAIGDEVVEVLTAWQRANGNIPLSTSAA